MTLEFTSWDNRAGSDIGYHLILLSLLRLRGPWNQPYIPQWGGDLSWQRSSFNYTTKFSLIPYWFLNHIPINFLVITSKSFWLLGLLSIKECSWVLYHFILTGSCWVMMNIEEIFSEILKAHDIYSFVRLQGNGDESQTWCKDFTTF